jgi:hypothetical protein
MTKSSDIQVAPPGTGLPAFQGFMLRYLVFPTCRSLTSWEKAAAIFRTEGRRLIELAQPLSAEVLSRRVAVKPLWGIEDSSRYWSAEMVLEHLIEVGTRIAIGVVELSHGQQPNVDMMDVNPDGGRGRQVVEDYIAFLEDYANTLAEEVGDKRSKLTYPHPCFGELTAHGCVCLAAVHQKLRCRQMERIVAAVELT